MTADGCRVGMAQLHLVVVFGASITTSCLAAVTSVVGRTERSEGGTRESNGSSVEALGRGLNGKKTPPGGGLSLNQAR